MIKSIEDKARDAYQAYGGVTDFKNYQGLPMPEWANLPPKIREAWCASVTQVIAAEQEALKPTIDHLDRLIKDSSGNDVHLITEDLYVTWCAYRAVKE